MAQIVSRTAKDFNLRALRILVWRVNESGTFVGYHCIRAWDRYTISARCLCGVRDPTPA
ncbi:hypothetical protein PILCRDRAFT_823409 [Piloderma croceum F 1598]|uniref:Uncharacterized protein n=1 Tax=Piloderma croceum (strain F 1598) TaxID=765440 RepID=A0A0C3FIE5_PILCF|nr:hypothetical protein PILCRDRAFT_823409 [Piloderma croceum F 1598]